MAAMFPRDVPFEPTRSLAFVALVDQLIGAASDFSGLISIKLHPLTDSNGNRKVRCVEPYQIASRSRESRNILS